MKTENFSLASATATAFFRTLTRVIRYDEGSGSSSPKIRVRSLGSSELDVEMQPGRQVKLPATIDGIVIENLSGAPITGKITIGAGDVSDNSLVGTVALSGLQGAFTRLSASVLSSGVTTLSVANAARRSIHVQNNDASIYLRLRVDGTDPTTSTGLRIPPGGSWESPPNYAPTGAVKVIAESGSVACEALEG